MESNFANVKILVVDDVVHNLKLMEAYCEILGCIFDSANNGHEAITKIKENYYDLCFMDIQMPLMEGKETTSIIRREITPDLPIIALTASSAKREVCLEAGMNAYLNKPVLLDEFRDIITKYARKLQA